MKKAIFSLLSCAMIVSLTATASAATRTRVIKRVTTVTTTTTLPRPQTQVIVQRVPVYYPRVERQLIIQPVHHVQPVPVVYQQPMAYPVPVVESYPRVYQSYGYGGPRLWPSFGIGYARYLHAGRSWTRGHHGAGRPRGGHHGKN